LANLRVTQEVELDMQFIEWLVLCEIFLHKHCSVGMLDVGA